jgi:glycosyltransferase involved in cell wall biosynthesis
LNNQYDLVILESESTAAILENKTLRASKTALRVHNNESKYFFQLGDSTGNILKKCYYYLDAIKFKHYSRSIFSKADRLWFISIDEMKEFISAGEMAEKAVHLPSSSAQKPIQQKLQGKKALFIGSLFMPNNINAIEWYLDNVHRKVIEYFPDYTFVIAGSTGDVKEEDLRRKFADYTNLALHFNVPDLAGLYADAALFVNPMQYGTGVKLKSLNAITNGLPLVSTHIGSEGIGLIDKEMFFKADSSEDFYDAISQIFMCSPDDAAKMVKKAQDFLNSNDYLMLLKKETDDLFKQV